MLLLLRCYRHFGWSLDTSRWLSSEIEVRSVCNIDATISIKKKNKKKEEYNKKENRYLSPKTMVNLHLDPLICVARLLRTVGGSEICWNGPAVG